MKGERPSGVPREWNSSEGSFSDYQVAGRENNLQPLKCDVGGKAVVIPGQESGRSFLRYGCRLKAFGERLAKAEIGRDIDPRYGAPIAFQHRLAINDQLYASLFQLVVDPIRLKGKTRFRIWPYSENASHRQSTQTEVVAVNPEIGAFAQRLIVSLAKDSPFRCRIPCLERHESAAADLFFHRQNQKRSVKDRNSFDLENRVMHAGRAVDPNVCPGCRKAPFRQFVPACGCDPFFYPVGVGTGFVNRSACNKKLPVGIAGSVVKNACLGLNIKFGARTDQPKILLTETDPAGHGSFSRFLVVFGCFSRNNNVLERDHNVPLGAKAVPGNFFLPV